MIESGDEVGTSTDTALARDYPDNKLDANNRDDVGNQEETNRNLSREDESSPTGSRNERHEALGGESEVVDALGKDETGDHEEGHTGGTERGDGVDAQGKVELVGAPKSSSPQKGIPSPPEWPSYCNPSYLMPKILDVRVMVDGELRTIPVEIEKCRNDKPYHGGYRHKINGCVYHHASTQFGQRKHVMKDTSHLRTRDTQTFRLKTRTMQTINECGTQMARKDMYLHNDKGTVRPVGRYLTAAEYWRIRARKVVVIQRFWRGYSARHRVWFKRERQQEQQNIQNEKKTLEEAGKEKRRRKEMQRRMNPSTVQDFEVLYNELDQWREAEAKRIQESGAPQAERQGHLAELLHKETRLLQTIDRLKITAGKEGKGKRVRHMLNLMSMPKIWEMSDGETAEIHTPWTNRAMELQELYQALEAPLLSVEERLDVLLHLKWTVKEFDCRLTRDIMELVDREADLLSRGRGEKSLQGLRQRIRNLFLRFIETPDFNPEATRFLRVPPRYERLTKETTSRLMDVSCQS